jgi:hypothetical protein
VMELNIIQDNEIFRVEQNRGGKLAEKLWGWSLQSICEVLDLIPDTTKHKTKEMISTLQRQNEMLKEVLLGWMFARQRKSHRRLWV